MKKRRRIALSVLTIMIVSLMAFITRVYIATRDIPCRFYITKGHRQTLIENMPVSLTTTPHNISFKIRKRNSSIYINPQREGNYTGNLKLFGFLPFKQVFFKVMPEISVVPGGNVIGIKLHSKGVMVIDSSKVKTEDNKSVDLADKYDIKAGDIIIKINNNSVNDTQELASLVGKCEGKALKIDIKREGKIIRKIITPLFDKKYNKYRLGIWVRDKTAGIGTMTFYDPKTKSFAALGHPIMDADTGLTYGVSKGTILKADILSVKKGVDGEPGELEGVFVDEKNPIGNIADNNQCGIYGSIKKNAIIGNKQNTLPVAYSSEVKEGKAYIMCTLLHNTVQKFEIEISRINRDFSDTTKNMIIDITDKRLLDKTGGIVQGMSGSPIIQNDKIVGAVTHVFVNNSRRGFAIFSELMVDKLNFVKNGDALQIHSFKRAI